MRRLTMRELRELRNDERRAAIAHDVAAGRLTIRQMTPAEREGFDAARSHFVAARVRLGAGQAGA
jgi:hypothetical protein